MLVSVCVSVTHNLLRNEKMKISIDACRAPLQASNYYCAPNCEWQCHRMSEQHTASARALERERERCENLSRCTCHEQFVPHILRFAGNSVEWKFISTCDKKTAPSTASYSFSFVRLLTASFLKFVENSTFSAVAHNHDYVSINIYPRGTRTQKFSGR